jgi:hypothetical protein
MNLYLVGRRVCVDKEGLSVLYARVDFEDRVRLLYGPVDFAGSGDVILAVSFVGDRVVSVGRFGLGGLVGRVKWPSEDGLPVGRVECSFGFGFVTLFFRKQIKKKSTFSELKTI